MSLFSKIKDSIFGRKAKASEPVSNQPATPAKPAPIIIDGSKDAPKESPPARLPETPASEPVDVEAVLTAMAEEKGGPSDWRNSIVDLLKLLDLDSSLTARKELAAELNVNAGAHGTAEQNIALHRAVMRKLEENGGKVPAALKD